jgi:rhodanese-related sulfurtransferase
MISNISPQQAAELTRTDDALLVDIRESDEFKAERIAGAELQPLSVLQYLPPDSDPDRPVIYFCHSGRRSDAARELLEKRGHTRSHVLEGGLEGWKKAGLPVEVSKGPLPIMRQVHIAAGSMVVLFMLIGQHLPLFRVFALFVGFGLIYSGITGWCGMMQILKRMPWNK